MGGFLALLNLLPLVLGFIQLQNVSSNIASSISDWLLPAQGDGVLGGLLSFKVSYWTRLF